ncbi:MAG: 16S rRNA (cytosine(1402)-N(4))-methyltransferase RsmH [Alphaproteobacteria bacterium]|nr:16S rRNA (cytosine(1402)-N(4))-methyltransferase RsmH [Alphaproteobacteria bacterium]
MLPEVLQQLSPVDGGIYVDGTFGAGGYSAGILESADCVVVAIDRDPAAIERAREMRARFGARLEFVEGRFGDVRKFLGERKVDGFVLDIGVSSFQIDEAERGFSFRFDGPLDMRMDTRGGATAADIVGEMEEKDLADLIYKYGEERHSRRIARKIVERRTAEKIETTSALAEIVRSCVPKSKDGIDPATRTFQALRIAVNDELGELERALAAAEDVLKPGGRMVVVSFHSLEDTLVKAFFRAKSGNAARASRYMPEGANDEAPVFDLLTRKAVRPSPQEMSENGRSRSARLRAVQKRAARAQAEGAA